MKKNRQGRVKDKERETWTEPLPWEAAIDILSTLTGKDRLYWAISIYTGYRVEDIVRLKWSSLKGRKYLNILEMKGMGKMREKARNIMILPDLKAIIDEEYQNDRDYFERILVNRDLKKMSKVDMSHQVDNYVMDHYAIWNKHGGEIKKWTRMRGNRLIKRIASDPDFSLNLKNFGCHTLRKTFAIRFWLLNGADEKALWKLKDIFHHTSIKYTRLYLGVTLLQKEHDEGMLNMVGS